MINLNEQILRLSLMADQTEDEPIQELYAETLQSLKMLRNILQAASIISVGIMAYRNTEDEELTIQEDYKSEK